MQSGLTSLGEDWSVFDLGDDPDKISRLLLKNIPQWEPGKARFFLAKFIPTLSFRVK